jgi:hypothetical protein
MALVMFLRFGKKPSLSARPSEIVSRPQPCCSGPAAPGKQLEYLAARHVPQPGQLRAVSHRRAAA